jgi:hypothetical protein
MALKKFFQQNTPDNGLGGDYLKIVRIGLEYVSGSGWQPGTISFNVFRDQEARDAGLAPVTTFSVQVPPAFFTGMTVMEDGEVTLGRLLPPYMIVTASGSAKAELGPRYRRWSTPKQELPRAILGQTTQ